MLDSNQSHDIAGGFFRPSLTRILLFWFLVLSLLPLGLVCLIGYQQSTQALRTAAIDSLSEGAMQQAGFIDNWFAFRFKDLRAQAEDRHNAKFIKALTDGLQSSGKTASNYVGSPPWVSLVEANKADLEQLMKIYTYYYDLFLIDLQGNVLFSVMRESDLGSNLLSGPYKDTQFASIVRQSLNNGGDLFSDLERYSPSGNEVAGFLSAPLLDESGEKVGVFAVQLKEQAITALITSISSKNLSQVSYLVGEDLLSRTAIHSVNNVLTTKIETAQTALWAGGHAGDHTGDHTGDGVRQYHADEEEAFDYVGPFGQKVLGVHHTVKIGNIEWGLIAEVDEAEALAPAQWMAQLTLMILLVLFLIVVVVAFFVSRRITQPLKALVSSSQRAAEGHLDQQVEIPAVEEMAQLGNAFNAMLESRRNYEVELTTSSEETFKALLELEEQRYALDQHALVSITDTAGTITFANEKFAGISGYAIDELLGKDHRILNSSHHHSSFFQEVYETLGRGEVWRGEICNRNKSGQLYWVDSTIVPFLDAQGVTTSYVAIRTDISARKQAEQDNVNFLRELEEQKYALDQHALVSITDIRGTITFANEKFAAISGYSTDELLGQDHRILNSSHHPSTFFHQIYQTLGQGEVWRGEICNRNKSGQLYWVDSTIVPFLDAQGVTTSYVAIRTDITARKQAELNSENSLAIVEATLEATDNGIVVLNEFNKAIHYNQRFLDLWHFSQEQVLFGDVNSMLDAVLGQLATGETFADTVQRVQASDGLFSSGAVNFKDGRILEYSSKDLLLPGEKKGQVWSFIDITAQTRAADELTSAKEAAEQATTAKGDFLANMSHEIRTPMNGVLGMLNLLSSSQLSAKQSHQVRLARSSGEALLVLINDILDFSKIEAGKLELESIDFDLRQLFGDLAESMALQAQSKGIEIVLDLAQIEQSRVKGDPTRVRQLLTNLIGNALKFTQEGEIVIRAALETGTEGEVTLSASVSDTGIGIPPDKVEHLFDSFSQVDASTTRKFGGTGLGLSIVKKLCELMGGDVSVSSELGMGSCFTFVLRLEVSENAAVVRPTINLNGVRILIVDDNATNREVLHGQLSLWGAFVTEADSGASALAILDEQAEEPFPVAIIDMQMPEMDGASLGEAIRADARFSSTGLIMMTSMSEPGDAQHFADLGFAAYFPKPTTTSDLFDALAIVLGGGEALQAAKPLITHNYLQSLGPQSGEHGSKQPLVKSEYRLLLAEDNVINQHVAMGMLEDMGYGADIADNGALAISMLQEAPADAPYQLILMDCQMPLLDGYEATAKIRSGEAGRRYRDITIVAMTANVMTGDREKCIQAGMDDYIAKPIDPEILENSLAHYLGLQSETSPLSVVDEVSDDSVETSTEGTASENQAWDREGLLKRVRGNETLLHSLLQQFLQDIPEQMTQFTKAVASTDFARVASLAHSLKGVVGNLSGQRLYELAAAMELAGGQEDKQEIDVLWPSLLSEYEYFHEILMGYLDEHQAPLNGDDDPTSQQRKLTPAQLKGQVGELRTKLQEGSFVDSEDLQCLKPHCVQDPGKALLATLLTQLAEFDLEAGMLTLDAIEQSLQQD